MDQQQLRKTLEELHAELVRDVVDVRVHAQKPAEALASPDPATWLRGLKSYTLRWIVEHLDGREDRWTSVAATSQPANAAAK